MKYLALLFLGVLFSVPVTSHAATGTDWEFVRQVYGDHFGDEILKEASYDEDDLVSVYRMRKGQLTDYLRTRDKVAASDQAIWNMFIAIAGEQEAKDKILVFGTYEDAQDPTLAFVTRLGKKDNTWILGANANAANPKDKGWNREMATVIVHEYGHILTLSGKQMDLKKKSESQCKKLNTYFVKRYGCTTPTSYLDAFVKKFWNEEDRKIATKAQNKGMSSGLYEANKSSYVTAYAATSPVEDIAESFTDFILRRKPDGKSVKEQKILFFYNYPELVEMRTQIRSRVGIYY